MPAKTPKSKNALTQVVISNVPRELLDQIDANAAKNNRTRTAEIRQMITERLSLRKQPIAA